MKVAVTGSAGFIGSHLAETLAAQGHQVVGIDSLTDYYDPNIKRRNVQATIDKGVQFFNIDLLDEQLKDALEGVEFVYHLAAQPGISATVPLSDYVRNNIWATHSLLEVCQTLPNFQCLINIATSSIYGKDATEPETSPSQPTSYYGVTKLAAEQLVLAYHRDKGLPATSMRLFSVCGPRERPEKLFTKLIKCIIEDTPFPLFEGSKAHSRSFTYVGDIVDGLISVIPQVDKAVGEIFNLGTTVEHTTGEGIEMIEQILGKSAQINTIPRRPGDQLRTRANIQKIQARLGYSPQTTLYQALEKQVEWYNETIASRV